ncbi:MAG: NAD(P)/FAD-dependent oxidoreductase, partial [Tepidimonas ignava]
VVDEVHHKVVSLAFNGDRVVGCNTVGWTDHVGALRGLVEGQVRLGAWKEALLRDPTQFAAAYLACAQSQHRWSGALDGGRR